MWQALEADQKGADADRALRALRRAGADDGRADLAVLDDAELVTVPAVGHADARRPEAVAAIDRLLVRVQAELVTA